MPYYYPDQQPSLGLGSSSLHATIKLDQPNAIYTNLDQISGRVTVRCTKSVDLSSIVVKLEGESRTRLLSPSGPNGERGRPEVEYHKILYRVMTVFPPVDVTPASGKAAYAIPPGQHEYPFSYKIPFNNNCSMNFKNQPLTLDFEHVRVPISHVKKTLPPTVNGFPGMAEIRYFVKVTVNRHSIFRENPRAYTPFKFFPIEPPRPPVSGAEMFARQKHTFSTTSEPVKEKKLKNFLSSRKGSDSPSLSTAIAPAISVDARLPEPAILTCNQKIPLRLIVKKTSDFTGSVYLQSLQISLIGHTKVRAHEVFRTESSGWIICSTSNMGLPIGKPSDPENTETVLDDSMWRTQVLPDNVAPSFIACNIERSYQLDVRLGLSYSGVNGSEKPQTIHLPLRLNTAVYSGIAPPPEVIARMAGGNVSTHPNLHTKASTTAAAAAALSEKLRTERQNSSDFGANQVPTTPVDSPQYTPPVPPPRPGTVAQGDGRSAAAPLPQYDDAPPSYEDAIAGDAPAVSGARPVYAVAEQAGEDELLFSDEKKGLMS